MSNDIIPTNTQLPAHLQGYVSKLTQEVDTITTSGSAIPLRLGRASTSKEFRFTEDGVHGPVIKDPMNPQYAVQQVRVIIIDKQDGIKSFFKDKYEEGSNAAPDCQSFNGARHPDSQVKNPQNFTCQNCKWDIFGSDGDGKKCKDQSALALIIPDSTMGDYATKPCILFPKGGDLQNLKAYWKGMQKGGLPIEKSYTLVSFDPDFTKYNKLKFTFDGYLEPDWCDYVDAFKAEHQDNIDEYIGRNRTDMTLEQYQELTGITPDSVTNRPAPQQAAPVAESQPPQTAQITPPPNAPAVIKPIDSAPSQAAPLPSVPPATVPAAPPAAVPATPPAAVPAATAPVPPPTANVVEMPVPTESAEIPLPRSNPVTTEETEDMNAHLAQLSASLPT